MPQSERKSATQWEIVCEYMKHSVILSLSYIHFLKMTSVINTAMNRDIVGFIQS